MLGWHISVYRQATGGSAPATADCDRGVPVAVWQGRIDATKWLYDLVEAGHAIDLGGNGYPFHLTAPAGALLPTILAGPPDARAAWISDPGDVPGVNWNGQTTIDPTVAADCADEEWLLVEIWDES